MKVLAIVVIAAIAAAAAPAVAGESFGHGRPGPGNGGPGWGWGPGLNVFVDVPMTGAASGAAPGPRQDLCREVRHSCFGLWGVEEPGYGQCMRRSGC